MRVYRRKILAMPARGLTEYCVTIHTAPLLDIARRALRNTSISPSRLNQQNSNLVGTSSHPPDELLRPVTPVRVWVLGPVLEQVLPAHVDSFNTNEAAKHQRKHTKDYGHVKRPAPRPKASPAMRSRSTSSSGTHSKGDEVRLHICLCFKPLADGHILSTPMAQVQR
jgi:hypothetical protein